jgi:hypothetical protein
MMQQRITVFRKRVLEINLQVDRARSDTPRVIAFMLKHSHALRTMTLPPHQNMFAILI